MHKQQHYTIFKMKKVKSQSTTPLRTEMCIYLFIAFIICLFVCFFYFQKSRNVFRHCTLYKTGSFQWAVFPVAPHCSTWDPGGGFGSRSISGGDG